VKRDVVNTLIQDARDVKRCSDSWTPDILMIVTDTGFHDDAKKIGKKNKIYLVKAKDTGFQFVGEMVRAEFNILKESNY
jgi:predicted nuclease of predicted toxin-antitoxin system